MLSLVKVSYRSFIDICHHSSSSTKLPLPHVWQAKLTFIHNYRLSISTIRIVDINNSNCGYRQF